MNKKFFIKQFIILLLTVAGSNLRAETMSTTRFPQFSNAKVSVWKTIVYPEQHQILKMHRHDHDRVVIALTDGLLKIKNNNGKIHYLKLKKDNAYYLVKDVPDELHSDLNMTKHAISVMVVELKN